MNEMPPFLTLLDRSATRLTTLAGGDVVFRAGDRARGLFCVEQGSVRLIRHLPDGSTATLHRANRGGLFAEAAVFADCYHCDAVAEQASLVRLFTKQSVRRALLLDETFAEAFTAHLARQVQDLRARIEILTLKSAADRVLAYLRLHESGGETVVDQSLKSLAGEIGITHEALYRTVSRLRKSGKIERIGNRFLFR